MIKRKVKIVLVGCLLALVAFWVLSQLANSSGDERKFRQLVRAERWSSRIHSIERFLPLFLIEKLRLEPLRLGNEERGRADKDALLGSGFLTIASIPITNLPPVATDKHSTLLEVYRRLRVLRGIDYWSFHMQSNRAIITCLPRDLERIKAGVENP